MSLRASVVVPVRNRPELLAQALDALVRQDLEASAYEIVVCDDGSTADIAPAVARFATAGPALRLERQPPRGPAAARNLGVRASHAPIVVFVDSDVIAEPTAVRRLVEALEAHPDWQGAEAALHPSGEGSGPLWDAPDASTGGRYHTAAIAYRRGALEAAGGFDEAFELPACEDVELASRVLAQGPIGFVAEARAWHPRRRVTGATHWRWRRHWRYEAILAARYGILAFPGRRCGPFPRLRVAVSAVASLPAGRLLEALRAGARSPRAALEAAAYALFDVLCGLAALPDILWRPIPRRLDHLARPAGRRVAMVVAAHRPYDTLELCLSGLRAEAADPADLIVVDNGSGGVVAGQAAAAAPGCTVIALPENRLFCGGYNAGLSHALDRGYGHVLLVNADTEVAEPGFVDRLLDVMDRRPRAAFVGPLVYYRDRGRVQTTCLRFPGLLRSALVWLPFRLAPQLVDRQDARERAVEFLNGVCVLCRAEALRQVGLMDESFGAYVEDADWAWRARRLGWTSVFTPSPGVIHHEEPHGYEPHAFKTYLLKRNTVLWLMKAGRPLQARGYAAAALLLARARGRLAAGEEERRAHSAFVGRLGAAFGHILRGEALGPYYLPGPSPSRRAEGPLKAQALADAP